MRPSSLCQRGRVDLSQRYSSAAHRFRHAEAKPDRLKYDDRRGDAVGIYIRDRVLFLTHLLRVGNLAALKHQNSA